MEYTDKLKYTLLALSANPLFKKVVAALPFNIIFYFIIQWFIMDMGLSLPTILTTHLILLFILGITIPLFPSFKREVELVRIRLNLSGEMITMAQSFENQVSQIHNLWKSFSSRPLFCRKELELTINDVYRKLLTYQNQSRLLVNIKKNKDENITSANTKVINELQMSLRRTENFFKNTADQLTVIAGQISLLESDSQIESDSQLNQAIESLEMSRRQVTLI